MSQPYSITFHSSVLVLDFLIMLALSVCSVNHITIVSYNCLFKYFIANIYSRIRFCDAFLLSHAWGCVQWGKISSFISVWPVSQALQLLNPVSEYYKLLCRVLLPNKPLNSWIFYSGYSNWTSWTVFNCLTITLNNTSLQTQPLTLFCRAVAAVGQQLEWVVYSLDDQWFNPWLLQSACQSVLNPQI